MGLKKGQCNNLNGRPKGAKNKASINIKNLLAEFIENGFDKFIQTYESLEPKEQTRLFKDLLQYVIPKSSEIDLTVDKDTEPTAITNLKIYDKPDLQGLSRDERAKFLELYDKAVKINNERVESIEKFLEENY